MWGFALLLVLQELWTYQGFFLVGFKLYTSGSWFNYNHWVNVLYLYLCFVSIINVGSRFSTKNLNFSFLGQLFQYYLLGLKACRLRFPSHAFVPIGTWEVPSALFMCRSALQECWMVSWVPSLCLNFGPIWTPFLRFF